MIGVFNVCYHDGNTVDDDADYKDRCMKTTYLFFLRQNFSFISVEIMKQ